MLIDRSHEPPAFRIESLDEAGVFIVAVSGELDLASAPVLDEYVDDACVARAPVLVDLCATSFMDSTGFRSLYEAHHAITRHGRRFALAAEGGGQIARLLALAGGDQMFERYPDRVTAITALRA